MVVGSKVRMLHGFGEGIITKIDGNKIMVMLNEGLEIPIRAQDLVMISLKQENEQIAKADPNPKTEEKIAPSKMFFVKEGLFLAGFNHSNSLVDFSLVNHTDFFLSVVVYKLGRPVNQYFTHFEIEPKSVLALPSALSVPDSNHLVGLHFQFLKYHQNQGNPSPLKEFRLNFSEQDWKKTISNVPIVEKDGYLFQLDGEQIKINAEDLKESLLTKKAEPIAQIRPKDEMRKLEWREIDLHIEKLSSDFGDMSAGQMLDIQLSAFEKAFDKALLDGVGSLIVIHGVGGGILKQEIHKRLSQDKQIKFFKDARREKFGYGATEIQF